MRENPSPQGPAAKLSSDPLILSSTSDKLKPLGFTLELGALCSEKPVTFLLVSAWDSEDAETASIKAEAARLYHSSRPGHQVTFLGNTRREVEVLRAAGAEAFFASHNIFVSEEVFRPLPDIGVIFDAIYSARPIPMKRHELAADISRVAYVSYPSTTTETARQRDLLDGLAKRPGHVVVNEIADGMPQWMPRSQVNEAFASASVGLCLSAVEGAMYTSMEYMLAGLPIVSTPSRGGRDVFFDPDYCFIAEPTPRAVREAAEALRARNVPRAYVRSRTLAKLAVHRQRFLAFLEEIKERHGIPRSYAIDWPFAGTPWHRWRTAEGHARDLFEAG